MKDKKTVDLFLVTEGDVDRTVLGNLMQKGVLNIQTEHLYPKRGQEGGREKAVSMACSFLAVESSGKRTPRRVVLFLDLDDKSPAGLAKEVKDRMARFQGRRSLRLLEFSPVLSRSSCCFRAGAGENVELLLVAVGDPRKEVSLVKDRTISLKKAMIEDHLLTLLMDQEAYGNFLEKERIKQYSLKQVTKKLQEIIDLMENQGMTVESSKEILNLWMALVGFRASPSTLAERLLGSASKDLLKEVFDSWSQAVSAFLGT